MTSELRESCCLAGDRCLGLCEPMSNLLGAYRRVGSSGFLLVFWVGGEAVSLGLCAFWLGLGIRMLNSVVLSSFCLSE